VKKENKNKTKTHSLLRKQQKKEDLDTRKKLIKVETTYPDPTKLIIYEMDNSLVLLISDEELDNKSLLIMSTLKDNKI
jgi:hypothetical protein